MFFTRLAAFPLLTLAVSSAFAAYQVTDFKDVAADYVALYGINDRGDMVGSAGDFSSSYAFVVRGGTVETIFDASLGSSFSAWAISNTGVVVVTAATDSDPVGSSYLWEKGKLTLLGVGLFPRGISPDGRYVAGRRDGGSAFVYDTVASAYLPIDGYEFLYDINNSGVVVGNRRADVPGSGHINMVGTTVNLHTGEARDYKQHVDDPGWTVLRGINDQGNMVGRFTSGGQVLGFYMSAAGDVETFQASPGVDTYLSGLNNAGVIVGSYLTADGNSQAFIALPSAVPEPGVASMLIAGLGFVGWRRRCQLTSIRAATHPH